MNSFCISEILSEHLSKTPEGYLIARSVPIARTGMQRYRADELQMQGGGKVVELHRSPEEVFSPATIASFEGKPIVSPHPPTFITPENISGYQKGHVQNVRRGGRLPDGEEALIADLIITDANLISRIEGNALRELSAGYDYKLDETSTEHDPTTIYQMRNIRGNHVAVVPSGRAGAHVRILDSAPAEEGEPMDVKTFAADVKEFFSTLNLKVIPANDSETVEQQEEVARRSKELRERTNDTEVELTEEEKKAKETKDAAEKEEAKKEKEATDKRLKDAEEELEEEKKKGEDHRKATDATLKALTDSIAKLVKANDKCTCDAEEEEAHDAECPMYEQEAEDADLIPTLTNPAKDLPKNPIPGADAKQAAMNELKRIAPIVKATGDQKAIDALNKRYKELKQGSNDGYTRFASRGDRARESRQSNDNKPVTVTSESFVEVAAQYLGKDPSSVTIKRGGK